MEDEETVLENVTNLFDELGGKGESPEREVN